MNGGKNNMNIKNIELLTNPDGEQNIHFVDGDKIVSILFKKNGAIELATWKEKYKHVNLIGYSLPEKFINGIFKIFK